MHAGDLLGIRQLGYADSKIVHRRNATRLVAADDVIDAHLRRDHNLAMDVTTGLELYCFTEILEREARCDRNGDGARRHRVVTRERHPRRW